MERRIIDSKIIYDANGNKHILAFHANDEFSTFPVDENNSNYQAYLAWVAEGNTAQPLDLDKNLGE